VKLVRYGPCACESDDGAYEVELVDTTARASRGTCGHGRVAVRLRRRLRRLGNSGRVAIADSAQAEAEGYSHSAAQAGFALGAVVEYELPFEPGFITKLKQLADALESGARFDIQVAGERVWVPAGASYSMPHERSAMKKRSNFRSGGGKSRCKLAQW
jgi:hypothetical protein